MAEQLKRVNPAMSLLVFMTSYFFAGKLGWSLAFANASAPAAWPPAGIALAVTLLWGNRLGPAIFLTSFVVNTVDHHPFAASLAMATGNTLEALVAASLVRKFANGRNCFLRLETTLLFLLIAPLFSPLISATFAVLGLGLLGHADWHQAGAVWSAWWRANMAGDLVITPFLVFWLNRRLPSWRGFQLLEGIALGLTLVLVGHFVFLGATNYIALEQLEYLAFPPLLWAIFRFGPRGTTAAILLVSGFAVWSNLQQRGPFGTSDPNASMLLLQSFIAIMSILSLMLMAVITERARYQKHLQLQAAISQVMTESTSAAATVPEILRMVGEMAGWDFGAVWQKDASGQQLVCTAVWSSPSLKSPEFANVTRQLRLASGVGLPGRIWLSGRPAWIEDLTRDENFARAAAATASGLKTALGVPMRFGGELLGVVEFFRREAPALDGELMQLLVSVCHQMELFIGRKQGEAALRASEERYHQLFELEADAHFLLDPKTYRVVDVNQSAQRLYGYARDEFLQLSLDDFSAEPEQSRSAVTAGTPFVPIRWHRKKNGERFAVEIVASSFESQGRPLLLAAIRDITPRRRAEERIAQLSRLGAILLGVDHAIVRIHDEQKLLKAICQIAVEKGGFKLAWVGMVSPDGAVKPVAEAGVTGYVEAIQVAVAGDLPQGRGAIGTAIRENRPVVVNDIGLDPRMAPWRERAEQFGLRYAAAFPIQISGQVRGAFSVYAPDVEIFDEDELNLLWQVSNDISFALTAMAADTERQRAEEELRKLSRAVEQSPASIVITDPTGAIEYVNPKFTHLTGYTAEEVRGKNPRFLKSDKMTAGEYQVLWQTIKQGKEWRGEFHNRKKNGELFWEAASISPVTDTAGNITHFIAVKEDVTARKQVEAALRESEEHHRRLLAELQVGVLIQSPTAEILFSNRLALELLGLTENQILGKTSLDPDWNVIHEDGTPFPGANHPVPQAIATRQPVRNVIMGVYRPGRQDRIWLLVDANPQLQPDGHVREVICIFTDLTLRKQAEKTLFESEARLRLINQQIPAIIWTTDLDFKITSISGLSLMDIGVKPAELTGKSLQEIHGAPNEVIPNIAAHLRALDGERRATELQFKNRIWRCNIEPLLDANRKAMGCIGVAMDITESKDMEARLQALAAIVQTSDDAIISITPEQIITSWNQGAQKLFGYAAEEAIGKNISIIIPAEESSRTAEVIRKVTRGEPVESYEAVRRRKDGTLRDVSINVSRIANPAQKTIAISAILRDITPRKQMEKTVLSISAQERRRVGHELHDGIGQHLAGMAFKAKVLEQDLATQASSLVPEARKIVELTNEAIRQTRLLASGFDPVDIEVGGLPTALRKLTQEISTLHDAACRFHCDVERMDLDKQINLALFRIAQEAITNAFRHGLARQVDVALTADDNRITLTIRDNGRGFSIAGQQHHGRGLGIMSYRANSLGGKLLIRSEPGEGTEITCTFKKSAETKAA